MQANHSSPLRGLVSGVVLGICFLLSWKAFICVIGCCCVLVLASRFMRWVTRHPALHRLAAACVLLVCQPRPIDGRLYEFCHPTTTA
jgi:hypothetical protein